MKRFLLIVLLAVMTANFSYLNARTVYGWCGYTAQVPDDASYNDIMLATEILNLLCDIDEFGVDIEDPDIPDNPGPIEVEDPE